MIDQDRNIDPDLFDELVDKAGKLATVTDNAATILSEEFEDMVTGPLGELKTVLKKCQPISKWDGKIRDSDIDIEYYDAPTAAVAREGQSKTGVRMTHKPTGISRESYNKNNVEDNERVARKALDAAIKDRYNQQVSNV